MPCGTSGPQNTNPSKLAPAKLKPRTKMATFPRSRSEKRTSSQGCQVRSVLYREFQSEAGPISLTSLSFFSYKRSTTWQPWQRPPIPGGSRGTSSQGRLGRACRPWPKQCFGSEIDPLNRFGGVQPTEETCGDQVLVELISLCAASQSSGTSERPYARTRTAPTSCRRSTDSRPAGSGTKYRPVGELAVNASASIQARIICG